MKPKTKGKDLPKKSNQTEKKSQFMMDGFKAGVLHKLFKE